MAALGKQILVEYQGCFSEILDDVSTIEKAMIQAAEEAGATVINSTFHHFSPYGVSGVVVIQESHLAIHTWPEFQYAAVDIFTCGDSVDPWKAYDLLLKAFQAKHGNAMEINRGSTELLKRTDFKINSNRQNVELATTPTYKRNVWLSNKNENIALSFRHTGELLYKEKSPFQTIEIYDTYAFGKMLTLDKLVMCTEKDEFIYHEMITHVPMQLHQKAKKILVIGGGDGGTLRELFKYERIESVTLVEIDEQVIAASKAHLPTIATDFEHPKLNIIINDGLQFLKNTEAETFDLIIVDSSHPEGLAEELFTETFYQNCYRTLKTDGALCIQSEGPFYNEAIFKSLNACLKNIFGKTDVHLYFAHLPSYPTGMWTFTFASKASLHPLNDFNTSQSADISNTHALKYYNAAIHRAAFALPSFVSEMLEV
jgi:spermidine synthase